MNVGAGQVRSRPAAATAMARRSCGSEAGARGWTGDQRTPVRPERARRAGVETAWAWETSAMRFLNMAASLAVIVVAFGGALGPRGLIRALPEWLSSDS